MRKNFLTGKTVVFTGAAQPGRRQDAKKAVLWCGGTVSNVIKKDTALLVYGTKAGIKLEKAMSLGIRTMTFKDFDEFIFDLTFNENNNIETGAGHMEQLQENGTTLSETVEKVNQQELILRELRHIAKIFRYEKKPVFSAPTPSIRLDWDTEESESRNPFAPVPAEPSTVLHISEQLSEDLKLKILEALPGMIKGVESDYNSSYEESLKELQHIVEGKANEQLQKNPPAPAAIDSDKEKAAAEVLKDLNISDLRSSTPGQHKALLITESLKSYLLGRSQSTIKVYLKEHTGGVFSATVYSADHDAVRGLEQVSFQVCLDNGIALGIVVNPPLMVEGEDLVLELKGEEA